MGTDEYGNKYYEHCAKTIGKRPKRWMEPPNGQAPSNYDPDRVAGKDCYLLLDEKLIQLAVICSFVEVLVGISKEGSPFIIKGLAC